MASITNLPTEIVESIARHLDMKDLCSFRLAQPAVIPAQTTDRLRELHLWNAATYTRLLLNADRAMEWDTSPRFKPHWDNLSKWTWVYEQERYDLAWIPVLMNISAHPVYSDWITSVCLYARLIKPQEYGAYQPRRLSAQGLGAALAELRHLCTLWLHGRCFNECSTELSQVLRDFLHAGGVPTLRNLVIMQMDCDAALLSGMLTKHASSLKEVTLAGVRIRNGRWVADVFPALQQCTLQFFVLHLPSCDSSPIGGVMFRQKYKYRPDLECKHIHFEGLLVRLDTGLYDFGIGEELVMYGVAGRRHWKNAIRWLCESRESFMRWHTHDYKDAREYFCDVNEELAYRCHYRVENGKGHEVPGELADDPWYDESMDDIFCGMYASGVDIKDYDIEEQMELAAGESMGYQSVDSLRGDNSQDSIHEPQDDGTSPTSTQGSLPVPQSESDAEAHHGDPEPVRWSQSHLSAPRDNDVQREHGPSDEVLGGDLDDGKDEDEEFDWSKIDFCYF